MSEEIYFVCMKHTTHEWDVARSQGICPLCVLERAEIAESELTKMNALADHIDELITEKIRAGCPDMAIQIDKLMKELADIKDKTRDHKYPDEKPLNNDKILTLSYSRVFEIASFEVDAFWTRDGEKIEDVISWWLLPRSEE